MKSVVLFSFKIAKIDCGHSETKAKTTNLSRISINNNVVFVVIHKTRNIKKSNNEHIYFLMSV